MSDFTTKAFYSVAEVAERLGISKEAIYRNIRANIIPHKKIGSKRGRYAIPVALFEQWISTPDVWSNDDD